MPRIPVGAVPSESTIAPDQRKRVRRVLKRGAGATPVATKEQELHALDPTEKRRLAVRALLARAERARTDLTTFYEFVIKHETTKQALTVAAHQAVQFAFVLRHKQSVLRQPVGTGKTFGMTALTLFLLGQDPTQRGAVLSKTQGQAAKVLRMVSDYITEPELNAALSLVFPWLKKSGRSSDTWTQTAITIDRPAGIRDPSAVAVGLDGSINGSRLSWLVTDDLLDSDNTNTPAAREQLHSRFDSRALSRLDPAGAWTVVTNTPWNREDMTYQLEAAGWPTLTMDIYGNFYFANVDDAWILSTGLLRRSTRREGAWRLVAHDPDPDEEVPLWPERYSRQTIAEIRSMRIPYEFARLYLCQPFDEQSSRCKREWIEACKLQGRGEWSGFGPVEVTVGQSNPVYTAVDIAIGKGKRNDLTAMVTYELLPNNKRRLLEVDSGQWSGTEIIDRLIAKHDEFDSIVTVESNNAQDFIRQFALQRRADLRIRAHNTQGKNKHDVDYGVESLFTEIRQGAWVFPCTDTGKVPKGFDTLFDECLFYQPPPSHTGDHLMAMWIARESSRSRRGGRDPKPRVGLRSQIGQHGGGF